VLDICDDIYSKPADRYRFTFFCAYPFSRRSRETFAVGSEFDQEKALVKHRRHLAAMAGKDFLWFTGLPQTCFTSEPERFVVCMNKDMRTVVVAIERIESSSSSTSTD
jgi:hypothetical protein